MFKHQMFYSGIDPGWLNLILQTIRGIPLVDIVFVELFFSSACAIFKLTDHIFWKRKIPHARVCVWVDKSLLEVHATLSYMCL